MKVKYLIEQLKKYNADDEIIVAYWDKDWFIDRTETKITDDHWQDIVGDGGDVIDNMDIGAYLYEAARVILDEGATEDE